LYHRHEWYDEISPLALSEAEFEGLLIQNANLIHPASVVVPYKKTVYADGSSARADLAIIPRDYRHWFVIEVEMVRHPLYRHVLPQVRTLRDGHYDQEHVAYLVGKSPMLVEAKVSDMLRGQPPSVIVLINKPDEEWRRELGRYGAYVLVFEIFRSRNNRHIFAIDGELPRSTPGILTELSFGLLPRCLRVASPAALAFGGSERVPIFVDGQVTYWERFQTATGVYLTPVGSMPLTPGRKYALVRGADGRHAIRPLRDYED
jgi:hypothetical protein